MRRRVFFAWVALFISSIRKRRPVGHNVWSGGEGVGPQCGRGQRAKKTGACALFRERERERERSAPLAPSAFRFSLSLPRSFFYTILFFSHVAALPFLFFISRRRREQQMMQWEWRSLACAFSLASSRVGHEDRTRMLFVFFFEEKDGQQKRSPSAIYFAGDWSAACALLGGRVDPRHERPRRLAGKEVKKHNDTDGFTGKRKKGKREEQKKRGIAVPLAH